MARTQRRMWRSASFVVQYFPFPRTNQVYMRRVQLEDFRLKDRGAQGRSLKVGLYTSVARA